MILEQDINGLKIYKFIKSEYITVNSTHHKVPGVHRLRLELKADAYS